MSEIERRASARHMALRNDLRERFPALLNERPRPDRSAIALGRAETGTAILLPQRARTEHAHVIGTTGGGKSKLLEHCIRQDIAAGRGVCVVDPHGEHPDSLYRSTLSWLHAKGWLERRKVHLVDPNAATHTIGFNPLARPDPDTDLSVIAGVTLEAFSRAWGGEDTSNKPTIERVLTATFTALAELNLTLVEAPLLLDRVDRHGLRAHALAQITDRYAKDELQRLHDLSRDDRRRHDFDLEVVGPINRLARFVRPAAIRSMIGQTERVLDMRAALDDGDIILCNLSGGARVYEKDADLLGRLLTRSLFFHAKRRRAPERPFFVYLDECHRYLSGDLENILAESRKYGVAAILSHQWQEQLRVESENMLAAVKNATNVKIVFRIKDAEEAEDLARSVVPLDLEIPVQTLIKPSVVGHRRIRLGNESTSEQSSITHSHAETKGESESYTVSHGESVSETNASSSGFSESEGSSQAFGSSATDSAGTDNSRSRTNSYKPAQGIFGRGVPAGSALGRGQSAQVAKTRGTNAVSGRSSETSRSSGSSHAETTSESWSESFTRGTSHAVTVGESHTRGTGRSQGSSEGLEPILADLPTAVHSKDSVLYMAAQTLRNLRTGTAFVSFVGASGLVSALLSVPPVLNVSLSASQFAALRERVLGRSQAAISIAEAVAAIADRERQLLIAHQAQDCEPKSFRTKAPPIVPEGEPPPLDAAGRGRSRPAPKQKKSSR